MPVAIDFPSLSVSLSLSLSLSVILSIFLPSCRGSVRGEKTARKIAYSSGLFRMCVLPRKASPMIDLTLSLHARPPPQFPRHPSSF